MSISDLIEDGSFEYVVKGDGYSYATDGEKHRFDVWDGDNHRAVPLARKDGLTSSDLASVRASFDIQFAGRLDGIRRVDSMFHEMAALRG